LHQYCKITLQYLHHSGRYSVTPIVWTVISNNLSIWVDQHEDAPKTITIIKEKRVDYLLLTTNILNVNSYNPIFQFIHEEVANIP
jgi:hypothetical protein